MSRLIFIVTFSGLMAISPSQSEEPIGGWSQDVLQLFTLQARDEALQKILKQARYPENPSYTEDTAGQIKEVVVCPQPDGPPLVTVFAKSQSDDGNVSPRSGHFIVIRNDGLILPFFKNANSLKGYFLDLNGDGVIDCVDSLSIAVGWPSPDPTRSVTELHIVPIQERFEPSLVVYWKRGAFTWRLHQPELHRNPTIQIGVKTETGFEPAAEYKWSTEENRWQGPQGSPEAKFIRGDGDTGEDELKLLSVGTKP